MKIVDTVAKWLDERTGLGKVIIDMATHLVPPGSKWYYVFGTAILTSFIVQLVSGVALATMYVPSAGEAYESIKYITTQEPFGKLIRGIHYWGASSMILLSVIHMIRVYLFGSYKFPRELNWLSGVALLLFTVAIGFTGQVLRWDQTSVWTLAVGAEQALRMPVIGKLLVEIFTSGPTISGATFSHYFALHVFIFPAITIGLIGLHVYLVLRNGISEPPMLGEPVDPSTYREKYDAMLKRVGRPFWPDAAWRDIVFSTIVIVGILACAIWLGPPHIENPPDPSLVKAVPHPDWYLMWYFALLALLPHQIEDSMIILFPVVLGVALVAVPFISNRGERSIRRRPWAVAIVVCSLAAIGALWREAVLEPWTPKFEATPLTKEIIDATTIAGSASIRGPEAGGTPASAAIYEGLHVFNTRGCLFCHTISGHGGKRGPDLTDVGDRLTHEQIVIRIINGGDNMPAYAGNITPKEIDQLSAFLETRKSN